MEASVMLGNHVKMPNLHWDAHMRSQKNILIEASTPINLLQDTCLKRLDML